VSNQRKQIIFFTVNVSMEVKFIFFIVAEDLRYSVETIKLSSSRT
jgi:hypothetical protein